MKNKFALNDKVSASVRKMSPYTPGEQPGESGWVKLNTNELPYAPSPKVREAVISAMGPDGGMLRLYPDPYSRELRKAVAEYYGMDAATHVSAAHLEAFYKTFDEVRNRRFDGMIITGAPVETIPFEEVDYWPELCEIMAWSRTHVHSTLHICWGAQAGLYFHHGIEKRSLPQKLFGVFEHRVLKPSSPLFRGFDDVFYAPHSRYTEVWEEDIRSTPGLELIAVSAEAGVYAVKTEDSRQFFVMGHPEYDPDTLAKEYWRDVNKGLDIAVPANYFPGDDPTKVPVVRWRSAGQLLYTNWLNYYVYQTTPYDLNEV